MVASFPQVVKSILRQLCPHDYPVLNSRLFFEIWLTFVVDRSLTSMRDLFYRLNKAGIGVDISTFSKARKLRQDGHFCRIYAELMKQLKRKNPASAQMLFPIDSTVITLKMHLKLDKLITKNVNGVTIQIYMVLIAYLLFEAPLHEFELTN